MIKKLTFTTLSILAGFSFTNQSEAAATTYYYNRSSNPGWSSATGWGGTISGPFNTGWVDGSVAYTGSGSSVTINATQNVSLEGMLRNGTGAYTLSKTATPTSPVTFTFSGGNIDAGAGADGLTLGTFTIDSGVTIAGNFSLIRGNLNLSGASGNYASHSGSITVNGGILNVNSLNRLSANSDLHLQSGSAFFKASSLVGNVQIDGGVFAIGSAGGVNGFTVEMKSLSGAAGVLRANLNEGINTSPLQQVVINQATNTTYAGTIQAYYTPTVGTGASSFQLKKSGAGDLTLSGTIQGLRRTTTIDGGRLYINGSTTSFGDTVGSTAISVSNGGALGGTGTISTLDGDHITVASDGKLIAGTFGQTGRTTYALGQGSNLDLSAASAQTEWLRFDLGSDVLAGTSYSQIALTSGTLVIGNALEFDDFDFNALSGFGAGTYTLFDVTGGSIFGSLGASNSGLINGYNASLSFDSNGIYLTVIPEPNLAILGAIGGSILLLRARRRK